MVSRIRQLAGLDSEAIFAFRMRRGKVAEYEGSLIKAAASGSVQRVERVAGDPGRRPYISAHPLHSY